jgi:CRP-like cAMP-binding protein
MIRNKILAKLTPDDRDRLADKIERLTLPAGEVLCEPGRPARFAVFPATGLLSSVVLLQNGATVEAAAIGNEGMAGLASLIDENANPYRIVQQIPGEVLRLPAAEFRSLVAANPRFREVVGRYALTLLQQHAQNAACNLHHRVEERMCRWLLSTADRVGGDQFAVTQEFLSELLGVSRQSVNLTAGQLQDAGLIAYRRGNLRITDRDALERAACECYQVTKETYDRLMRPFG